MQSVTIQTLLNKEIESSLDQLIYVVHDADLVFYVGQSKRNVIDRFYEHIQKPSRLGELIELNKPESFTWQVDFYTLVDCRPFVRQKSLFSLQAWERFDMDMAEQALIHELQPVLNRDFNPKPTPLPLTYRGQHLATESPSDLLGPQHRVWLNRMSLQGWTYARDDDGRLTWHHRDGRLMTDKEIIPFREANNIP